MTFEINVILTENGDKNARFLFYYIMIYLHIYITRITRWHIKILLSLVLTGKLSLKFTQKQIMSKRHSIPISLTNNHIYHFLFIKMEYCITEYTQI